MSRQLLESARPRSALRLIFDSTFAALFWGKLLAAFGVWMHGMVAAVVVYDATGSALMVGLVGVAQFGPQIVLSPVSGKWADRGNPARQILVGRVLCFVGSGALAVYTAVSPALTGNRAVLPVLAASVLVGLGFVVGGPAMQSIVPSLLRPGELSTAMALNTVPMTVARMGGPVLGAYILAHFGPTPAFAASATAHLVFAILLVVVRFPAPPGIRPGVDYRVRAALRHVWADRPLFLLLLAVGVVGFGSDPSITLAPPMAEELDGGTGLVGVLSGAFGGGAAFGLAVLAALGARISSAVSAAAGLWFLCVGLLVVGLSPVPAVALAGFAIAGFGFAWGLTELSTLVQERAPEELRGRIMALWLVGFIGSRPIAAAVLGTTADVVSVRTAFVAAAALAAVTALVCRPRTLVGPALVPSGL